MEAAPALKAVGAAIPNHTVEFLGGKGMIQTNKTEEQYGKYVPSTKTGKNKLQTRRTKLAHVWRKKMYFGASIALNGFHRHKDFRSTLI